MQVSSPKIARLFPNPSPDIGDLTWNGPYLYAVDRERGRLIAVDTWSGLIEYSIPLYKPEVVAVAFHQGLLWQVCWPDREIVAIRPDDMTCVHRLRLPETMGRPSALDIANGKLWMSDPIAGGIVAIDQSSGVIRTVFKLDRNVSGIACSKRAVYFSESGSGLVGCVDEQNGRFEHLFEVSGKPSSLVYIDHKLWYIDTDFLQLTEISLL